jgi:hypothetical protein
MNQNDLPLRGAITQPTLLLMHIMAGRSILTVRSRKTGEHYTFRFSRPAVSKERDGQRARPVWVSLYGGPQGGYLDTDAERRNWTFIGTIWPNHNPFSFSMSSKSKLAATDKAALTAAWMARRLPEHADLLMEQAEWWHEGICGRCGRRLTVPESIESGFGPECRAIVGV